MSEQERAAIDACERICVRALQVISCWRSPQRALRSRMAMTVTTRSGFAWLPRPATGLLDHAARSTSPGPATNQVQPSSAPQLAPALNEESRADGPETGATMHGWTSDRSSSPAQAPRSG